MEPEVKSVKDAKGGAKNGSAVKNAPK